MPSRITFVAPLLLATTSALDMVVQKSSMICDNRPVKASFSTVCTNNDVCTFGQTESIAGSCEFIFACLVRLSRCLVGLLTHICSILSTVVYNGLQNYYNVTHDDSFYVDATVSLGLGGLSIFQKKLVDNMKVPVCSSFTASSYNTYGDCPADGRYMFSASYRFPAPESSFMDWASSGYEGQIKLDIFYRTELVGRCVVGAQTLVSGSYQKEAFKATPSGKVGAIVVLTVLGALIFYVLYNIVNACRVRRRRRKQTKLLGAAKMPQSQQEPTTEYSRMEAGESKRPAESRYTSDGPVI